MQNRRDIRQLADAFQTCAAEFSRTFVHQSGFRRCLCGASGSNDNHIVGDQFLHQLDMSGIRTDFRVVVILPSQLRRG